MKLSMIILIKFITRKPTNEKIIALSLTLFFIPGVDKLRTNKRQYADPAIQAPAINIDFWPT